MYLFIVAFLGLLGQALSVTGGYLQLNLFKPGDPIPFIQEDVVTGGWFNWDCQGSCYVYISGGPLKFKAIKHPLTMVNWTSTFEERIYINSKKWIFVAYHYFNEPTSLKRQNILFNSETTVTSGWQSATLKPIVPVIELDRKEVKWLLHNNLQTRDLFYFRFKKYSTNTISIGEIESIFGEIMTGLDHPSTPPFHLYLNKYFVLPSGMSPNLETGTELIKKITEHGMRVPDSGFLLKNIVQAGEWSSNVGRYRCSYFFFDFTLTKNDNLDNEATSFTLNFHEGDPNQGISEPIILKLFKSTRNGQISMKVTLEVKNQNKQVQESSYLGFFSSLRLLARYCLKDQKLWLKASAFFDDSKKSATIDSLVRSFSPPNNPLHLDLQEYKDTMVVYLNHFSTGPGAFNYSVFDTIHKAELANCQYHHFIKKTSTGKTELQICCLICKQGFYLDGCQCVSVNKDPGATESVPGCFEYNQKGMCHKCDADYYYNRFSSKNCLKRTGSCEISKDPTCGYSGTLEDFDSTQVPSTLFIKKDGSCQTIDCTECFYQKCSKCQNTLYISSSFEYKCGTTNAKYGLDPWVNTVYRPFFDMACDESSSNAPNDYMHQCSGTFRSCSVTTFPTTCTTCDFYYAYNTSSLNAHCLSCKPNHKLVLNTTIDNKTSHLCLPISPPLNGTYSEKPDSQILIAKLEKCHEDCLTCDGPEEFNCLSCKKDWCKLAIGNFARCINTTEHKYYAADQTGNCIECSVDFCKNCYTSNSATMECRECMFVATSSSSSSTPPLNLSALCPVPVTSTGPLNCKKHLNGTLQCLECGPNIVTIDPAPSTPSGPHRILQDEWKLNLTTWRCLNTGPGDGSYALGNEIAPCSASCKTCQNSATECTSCKPGMTLDSVTKKCYPTGCSVNQYLDSSKICKDIPSSCDTFIEKSVCLSCKPERYLDGTSCAQCAAPQKILEEGKCQKCSINCKECSGFSQRCISCPAGKTLNATTMNCVDCDMSKGFYKPLIKTEFGMRVDACKPCGSSCQTCSGENICLSCKEGLFLLNSKCVDCKGEGYFETKKNGIRVCEECDSSCKDCSGSKTHCTKCDSGLFLDKSSSICTQCDESKGVFKDFTDFSQPLCHKCDPSCSTCINEKLCKTCPDGKYKYSNLTCGDCLETNYARTKGVNGVLQCLKCHKSCLTCKGPKSIECLSCPPSRLFKAISLETGSCFIRKYVGFVSSYFMKDLSEVSINFDYDIQMVDNMSPLQAMDIKIVLNSRASLIGLFNGQQSEGTLGMISDLTEALDYSIQDIKIRGRSLKIRFKVGASIKDGILVIRMKKWRSITKNGDPNIVLNDYYIVASDVDIKILALDKALNKVGTQAKAVVTSVSTVLFFLSIPQAFILMKVFQAVDYYIFIDSENPPNFTKLLEMLSKTIMDYVPNLLSSFSDGEGSPVYPRFENFGMNIHIFDNLGQHFTLLIGISILKLLAWLLFKLFGRYKRVAKVFRSRICLIQKFTGSSAPRSTLGL